MNMKINFEVGIFESSMVYVNLGSVEFRMYFYGTDMHVSTVIGTYVE